MRAHGVSVLVQGAGGGVATAAVVLANALGKRVYATSREAWKRERIAALGATALENGARLPERVDVVIESVGAPTFDHSMKSSKPGARIVVCGATAGHQATVDLRRVFAMRLEILGSTMGTPTELAALLDLMVSKGIRPVIDSTYGFTAVADAFARLRRCEVFGLVASSDRPVAEVAKACAPSLWSSACLTTPSTPAATPRRSAPSPRTLPRSRRPRPEPR